MTKTGFQLGHIRYWDPALTQLCPLGTRLVVRYDPKNLSKVYVSSTATSGYLELPYADLRHPSITLQERESARKVLQEGKDGSLTEDRIFAATLEQRRLKDAARRTTRRTRRLREMRPKAQPIQSKRPKIDYGRKVIPYKGETW